MGAGSRWTPGGCEEPGWQLPRPWALLHQLRKSTLEAPDPEAGASSPSELQGSGDAQVTCSSGAQAGVLSPQTQLAPWAEVLPACRAGPDLPECPSGLSPGTSLLQEVVYLVSQGADPDEIGLKNIDEQLPVLEYPQPGLDIIKVLRTSATCIRGHSPSPVLAGSVIYMARNPKDLVVSYYQFHRSLQTMSYRGTFQEFCRRFMNDKLGYGSWFEHVQEFWEHRMDANVLFLKYEDMHRVSAGDAVPWGPLPAGAVGCAELARIPTCHALTSDRCCSSALPSQTLPGPLQFPQCLLQLGSRRWGGVLWVCPSSDMAAL
uniref:Sulfotransferase n=1 Tax=Spermophilus dauricus TaxID=99837 RepID=A0A8C9QJ66_SPEDA